MESRMLNEPKRQKGQRDDAEDKIKKARQDGARQG